MHFVLYSILSTALFLGQTTRAAGVQRRDGPSTNAVCKDEYAWMNNEAGLSPCLVWAHVMTSCGTEDFDVLALPTNSHYDPPGEGKNEPSECSCSWAGYNLMGACTVCQDTDGGINAWGPWKKGCPDSDLSNTTYFPYDHQYTLDVKLPYWASEDPMTWTNSRFDAVACKALDDQGHADLDGSELSGGSGGSDSSSSTPVGPIVGGVVGGVALIIAIVLAWWFFRRRQRLRNQHAGNSQAVLLGDGSEHRQSHYTATGTMSMIQSPPVSPDPLSDGQSFFGSLHGSSVLMSTNLGHQPNGLYRNGGPQPSTSFGTHPPSSFPMPMQPIGPQDVIEPFTSTSSGTGTPPRGKAGMVYNTPPRRAQVDPDESVISDADTSFTPARRMNPPAYTSTPSPPAQSPSSFEMGHRPGMHSGDSSLTSAGRTQSEGSTLPGDFGDRMMRSGGMARGVDRPVGPSEAGDVDPAQYA
ncbi:hypothetical protein CYLTODRAFT_425309 [Cylindrobasidium torrendii FP15055 ss-10]|uniref:Cyanovirin-N domain-containing protein n=1 Tax=Cylindrobasidium torrendii FP15055 ss-10 TaxID=1314674 RepID=A0A0D7B2E8_9AGAR|nr:hypothetical protein CYLTODRAFT_425309 [Cylindrobasidium torrendii FP15055 ss-10]